MQNACIYDVPTELTHLLVEAKLKTVGVQTSLATGIKNHRASLHIVSVVLNYLLPFGLQAEDRLASGITDKDGQLLFSLVLL